MTNKLSRDDLWSLEQYAVERPRFRAEVIEHKKTRRIALGEHATLCFEDAMTMRYQVQEMLRVERIFEADQIAEELDAYNPLIPDGDNWKATLMIEYPDVDERRERLAAMRGIEHHLWVQAGDGERVFAIANEDLERSNDDKTAAVHFLKFVLPGATIAALQQGATLRAGIDHDALRIEVEVQDAARQSLLGDLADHRLH